MILIIVQQIELRQVNPAGVALRRCAHRYGTAWSRSL